MAKRLDRGEELHLVVSPKSRPLHQGYGPGRAIHHVPVVQRAAQRAHASEHLYSPIRLPLSRIDVFNTLMAPLVSPSWSLVMHLKTMHAFTTPGSLGHWRAPYRQMNYPRSVRLADAIIINSESLRSEVQQLPRCRPGQAQADPRGRRPRPLQAGRR